MTKTDFPHSFNLHDELFYGTGKYGTRIATGEQAAEYESVKRIGFRCWRTAAGKVYPE